MTAADTLWVVTEIAHPALRGVRGDCDDCLALTSAAITNAKVTGSRGATYAVEPAGHSVTVATAITVTLRPGGLDIPDRLLAKRGTP